MAEENSFLLKVPTVISSYESVFEIHADHLTTSLICCLTLSIPTEPARPVNLFWDTCRPPDHVIDLLFYPLLTELARPVNLFWDTRRPCHLTCFVLLFYAFLHSIRGRALGCTGEEIHVLEEDRLVLHQIGLAMVQSWKEKFCTSLPNPKYVSFLITFLSSPLYLPSHNLCPLRLFPPVLAYSLVSLLHSNLHFTHALFPRLRHPFPITFLLLGLRKMVRSEWI